MPGIWESMMVLVALVTMGCAGVDSGGRGTPEPIATHTLLQERYEKQFGFIPEKSTEEEILLSRLDELEAQIKEFRWAEQYRNS